MAVLARILQRARTVWRGPDKLKSASRVHPGAGVSDPVVHPSSAASKNRVHWSSRGMESGGAPSTGREARGSMTGPSPKETLRNGINGARPGASSGRNPHQQWRPGREGFKNRKGAWVDSRPGKKATDEKILKEVQEVNKSLKESLQHSRYSWLGDILGPAVVYGLVECKDFIKKFLGLDSSQGMETPEDGSSEDMETQDDGSAPSPAADEDADSWLSRVDPW